MAYSEVREISISNECAPPLFFRSDNEAISSRSDCVFHQIEGLLRQANVRRRRQTPVPPKLFPLCGLLRPEALLPMLRAELK